MFSKKATKIVKIFTVELPLFSKCQIDGKDYINFCGLLRIHELYLYTNRNILVYPLELWSKQRVKVLLKYSFKCTFETNKNVLCK